MTPVPLDLPLPLSTAADLAQLILEQAERKPLTDEVRNRIAARGSVLKLDSVRPFFGSLARDPVHPSGHYLAVDGARGEPLLLHIAPSTAPTSSIFYKPLLIGRTRRPNGPEMVINAIPFGPTDHETLDKFAMKVDTAFLPRPHGARAAIAVCGDFSRAFEVFRAIWKRTGRNVAAIFCPPGASPRDVYSAGLWAAIRAGWREGYSAGVEVSTKEEIQAAAACSLFRIAADAGTIERLHEHVRQCRSVARLPKAFDLEVVLEGEPEIALEALKANGHAAQLLAIRPGDDLERMAAVARQFQCGLSAEASAGPAVARATAGRVQYRVAEEGLDLAVLAEQLVG